VGTLSGGNQQKLVLARELEGKPPLIVAINPTQGLDISAGRFVREELRAAADAGAAVVAYSSDLDELLPFADRLLVTYAGRVVETPVDRKAAGAAMIGL
jgi:simple sugar transport system ATP-binding protein